MNLNKNKENIIIEYTETLNRKFDDIKYKIKKFISNSLKIIYEFTRMNNMFEY